MANNLSNSNILRVDTAAVAINSKAGVGVFAMQWTNDIGAAGGIPADDEGLSMMINGTLVTLELDTAANVSPLLWGIQFCQPFQVHKLEVVTIDGGTLYIWTDGSPND